MSTTLDRPIRDGDVFRWRFSDDAKHRESHAYWCMSNIVVASSGWLVDTYWGLAGSEKRWSYTDAQEKHRLEFIANFDSLDRACEADALLYEDGDFVNLNHPNSSRGNCYIRKGARRSAAKMLGTARYNREAAIGAMLSLASDIRRLDQAIRQIERGDDLKEVYL